MTALHTPNVDQPIPLDQPLPHRKTLREWLVPLSERSTARAFVLLAFDYALFFALIAATINSGMNVTANAADVPSIGGCHG